MKTLTHFIFIGSILMLSSTKLVAQQQDTAQNEEFEFSVNYKPIIAESKRMEETPVIKKEKSIKPTFTYSVIPIQFQTNKIVHTLPPVNHKLKINDTINGNYAKFGMGNINAFLGELYLSNRKNEKHGYGLYYNHLSSKERKTVQAWNDNKLVLFGNVYTKKFKYGASFDYNRIKNNYYGYNQDSVENTTDDNFDNLTNSYAISSYLSNVKPNRYGFNIENKMDFHYFESQLNMKESFYKLNSTISKKVNRDIKGTLGLGLSYTTNENGVDTLDIEKRRLNFRIRPGVEYAKGKSVFGGAINAVVSNANKENHYLFIYPQLYLRHALIKDELNLFANLTGDIKEYTYKELYSINPFIGEKGYLQNETTSWQIKGGVNGKISPKSNFYLELGLKKMSNMLLLVNNRDSFNRFSPVASSGNVTFVKANVDYSILKKIRFGLGVNFSDYNFDSYGLPTLVLDAFGQYKLGDKIMAKASITSVGSREQYDFVNNQEVTLLPYTDLSLGLEYFYKKFSVFVQGNNLLGKSYERYYNYDSYGLNIVGGLTARF